MKKTIVVALLILSACGPSKEEMEKMAKAADYKDYEEKMIDGCKYIVYNGTLTHKANCNNHINNQ